MLENTLTVGRISEGFVLDHIEAGKSMEIYKYLHLDKLDCCVAIIKNAKSNKMGKKDIMKIASAQVTAMQSCKKLISDLKKEYGEVSISFEIEDMIKIQDFFEGCSIDKEFGKVLEKLNDLLHIKAVRGGRRQEGDKPMKFAKPTWDEEQETVTRTDIIAAYFYKFN